MFESPDKPKIIMTGIGHFHPETVIDNTFFDELDIGSDSDWIFDRVGIKERRSVLTKEDIRQLRRGETNVDELRKSGRIITMAKMVKDAWLMAQKRRGTHELLPDMVISGSSIPDWDIPANACTIASEYGIECFAVDINSACSSFVVDLHFARSAMLNGAAKTAVVFNAERYTTRMDYTDRKSCILFGDAATSTILDTNPEAKGLEVLDTVMHSSPAGFDNVQIAVGGCFEQRGSAVQKFAIKKTISATQEILSKHGLTPEEIRFMVPHQANYAMLMNACHRAGMQDHQILFNVDTKGNQGACGAPSVLSENWDSINSGDYVIIAVVGSGLSWGAALLRKN